MRRTSRTLIILQTLGVEAATLLAMFEIKTIPFSGSVLSATGLAIAYISFRRNRPYGLCCGLVAPTAFVLCFSLICAMQWGPEDVELSNFFLITGEMGWNLRSAEAIMWGILAAVAVIHVLAAFLADSELMEPIADDRPKVPFQFSIMSLLVLMSLVAVFCGLCKTFGGKGAAIGVLIVYPVVVAYGLRQFHVCRARTKENGVEKGSPVCSPPIHGKDYFD